MNAASHATPSGAFHELDTHPELAHLMPPLSALEAKTLEKAIVDAGAVHEPIEYFVLEGRSVIVDGHHRYWYARANGVTYRTVELQHVKTLDHAKVHMFAVAQHRRRNLGRRKASYVRGLHYLQVKAQGRHASKVVASVSKSGGASGHSGQRLAADEVGRIYGISSRTIRRDGKFAELVRQLAEKDGSVATAVLDDECHVKPVDLIRARDISQNSWTVVIIKMVRDRCDLASACRKVGVSDELGGASASGVGATRRIQTLVASSLSAEQIARPLESPAPPLPSVTPSTVAPLATPQPLTVTAPSFMKGPPPFLTNDPFAALVAGSGATANTSATIGPSTGQGPAAGGASVRADATRLQPWTDGELLQVVRALVAANSGGMLTGQLGQLIDMVRRRRPDLMPPGG